MGTEVVFENDDATSEQPQNFMRMNVLNLNNTHETIIQNSGYRMNSTAETEVRLSQGESESGSNLWK